MLSCYKQLSLVLYLYFIRVLIIVFCKDLCTGEVIVRLLWNRCRQLKWRYFMSNILSCGLLLQCQLFILVQEKKKRMFVGEMRNVFEVCAGEMSIIYGLSHDNWCTGTLLNRTIIIIEKKYRNKCCILATGCDPCRVKTLINLFLLLSHTEQDYRYVM